MAAYLQAFCLLNSVALKFTERTGIDKQQLEHVNVVAAANVMDECNDVGEKQKIHCTFSLSECTPYLQSFLLSFSSQSVPDSTYGRAEL